MIAQIIHFQFIESKLCTDALIIINDERNPYKINSKKTCKLDYVKKYFVSITIVIRKLKFSVC